MAGRIIFFSGTVLEFVFLSLEIGVPCHRVQKNWRSTGRRRY